MTTTQRDRAKLAAFWHNMGHARRLYEIEVHESLFDQPRWFRRLAFSLTWALVIVTLPMAAAYVVVNLKRPKR